MFDDFTLVEALRNGATIEELMSDFQEQLLDAHTEYTKEQEEQKKKNEGVRAAQMREDDLTEIRENLAVDMLEWLDATGLVPSEHLDELSVDDMVTLLKEVEKMHIELNKFKDEAKKNWKNGLNLFSLLGNW